MKIMGKEFRTIHDGLDPNEVIEFLKTVIGSSEDSFERLEQFSTIKVATKAIDESIAQARQIAELAKQQAEAEVKQESERTLREAKEQAQKIVESAKQQAEAEVKQEIERTLREAKEQAQKIVESAKQQAEAEAKQESERTLREAKEQAQKMAESAKQQAEAEVKQESERTLREAKEQAQKMVGQTKNNCDVLIDDVRSVLTDAINRAREKANEIVTINPADLDNDIHQVEVSQHNQIPVDRQQYNGKPSDQSTNNLAIDTTDEIEDELEEDIEPDLNGLQRSLEALENSLAGLDTSEDTVEDTPEFQSPEEPNQDVGSKDESPETKGDDRKTDQYIGEVLVAIPGGADESWLSELRQQTLKLPGARIKAESSTDDNTIILTLTLEEPTSLRSVLQKMPNVEEVLEDQASGESSDEKPVKFLHMMPKKPKCPTFIVKLDRSSDVPSLL
jgi:cell division septum initiation protein DivIVA